MDISWIRKVTTKSKKISRKEGIPLTGDNGAWEVSQRANNPSRFISGDYRYFGDKESVEAYYPVWKNWYAAEAKAFTDGLDGKSYPVYFYFICIY
jgi:hypothetical protein